MKVPIFDLKVENKILKEELTSAFLKVISKGKLFLGDEVEELEEIIANYIGVKYAVGVSSGSSAIFLALKASGIGEGDEVITTPLTWIIPSNAIVACNAKPVFADVCEDFNLDPVSVIKKISPKTKAILLMHYAGHMCKMDEFIKIANKHNIKIIEDAAQAFGASLNNKKAGSYSTAAGFSMNPMKSFGGYGEAGVSVTNDENIYKRIKMLRHAGTTSDYKKIITNNCIETSLNHKMDTINAALLLVAFKHLKEKKEKIEKIATLYKNNLNKAINHQNTLVNEVHGRYVYPIYVNENRDNLKEYLELRGIETKIMNQPLVYNAPAFLKYKQENLKKSEEMISKSLIIPCHEKLNNNQTEFVIKSINDFF